MNDTSDIKATPQWDEINAIASKFEVTIVGTDARKHPLRLSVLPLCVEGVAVSDAIENLAGPIAAHQIRPHIVRDRAVRAWLGRATLATRLNSCSQPSAELFVLLLETSQSLHTAFFNDKISL